MMCVKLQAKLHRNYDWFQSNCSFRHMPNCEFEKCSFRYSRL